MPKHVDQEISKKQGQKTQNDAFLEQGFLYTSIDSAKMMGIALCTFRIPCSLRVDLMHNYASPQMV